MNGRIEYAKHGDVHHAYRIDGDGPPDLLYLRSGTISIDSYDDEPRVAAYFRRLASFARLVRIDPRGVGLSDPIDGAISNLSLAQDALAVADAAGIGRFALVGEMGGGPAAIECAALAPDRVDALVLVNTYARAVRDDAGGYPYGHPPEALEAFLRENVDPAEQWTAEGGDDVALIAPSLADDEQFRDWWARAGRRGASPATASALQFAISTADQRALLASLSMPTLVLHSRDNRFIPSELGRYLAEHIRGARFVEVDGGDAAPWAGGGAAYCDEIEEFLTGRRSGPADRRLVTLLFTDIVGSTDTLAQVGDASWLRLLELYEPMVRSQIARYAGREVSTAGDSFFAVFGTPSQAIECARSVIDAARALGIEIRAGVHTGECDVRGDDYSGLAVVIGARVCALAGAGEVLVTATVRDLMAGSPQAFTGRGVHTLKGVPGEWSLLAAE